MLDNFKIYVINLKRETKRRKNIIEELKKQNIQNFEIIDAIDGEKINKSDLDLLISKNNKFINPINTNMNAAEICCSLSHIKVYKKFIETNIEYALPENTVVEIKVYNITSIIRRKSFIYNEKF